MGEINKNGIRYFFAIVGVYIIYPFLYYYSMHLRSDYIFINAFDAITNALWITIGALSGFSLLRSFWLVSRSEVSNRWAFFKFPLLSLGLFILFWIYSFVPTYIDYGLN